MNHKACLSISLFFCLITLGNAFAQTPGPSPSPSPSPNPTDKPKVPAPIPEPYTEEEFPAWMLSLRRAEIIFFGSLPFSFLLAVEGVEIGRYFAHDFNPIYQPFPIRNPQAPEYTPDEQLLIIGSALIISGIFALVDFIITEATRAPPPE